MKLHELSIHDAHECLMKKEISSQELTKAVLDRIDAVEESIGAYITVSRESAMSCAEQADQAILKGDISPLTGIPLAIKDLICTEGQYTTCGSRILKSFVPPYDASVTEKLKKAGAVIVGKTNMDEFAMGSSTENSGIQLTHNPWNTECIPGGPTAVSALPLEAERVLGPLG